MRKLPIGTLPLKSRAWNLCEKAAEHKKAEIHIQRFCQTIQLEIIPQKHFLKSLLEPKPLPMAGQTGH